MPKVFNNQTFKKDSYHYISDIKEASDSTHDILIPSEIWHAHSETLLKRTSGKLGLQLQPDKECDSLSLDFKYFDLIDIAFPDFTDGRGFSLGSMIRNRYGYMGELRASGPVFLDQLLYLSRCGFDSFLLNEDLTEQAISDALESFSVFYQRGADESTPLYQRRKSRV